MDDSWVENLSEETHRRADEIQHKIQYLGTVDPRYLALYLATLEEKLLGKRK